MLTKLVNTCGCNYETEEVAEMKQICRRQNQTPNNGGRGDKGTVGITTCISFKQEIWLTLIMLLPFSHLLSEVAPENHL